MKIQSTPLPLLMVYLLSLSACAPAPMYHWGAYEDSLHKRYLDASDSGRAEAFEMLEATIREAEADKEQVPPGIYADYGYLLFQQGKVDAAIVALQKEGELYPESKQLMDTMISRIQEVQVQKEQPL